MSPRFTRAALLFTSLLLFLAAIMFAVAGVLEAQVVRFGGENILFIVCIVLLGVVLLWARSCLSTDHWNQIHRD